MTRICKGRWLEYKYKRDDDMSEARRCLNWSRMFELAIDPEKAKQYRAESQPEHEDTCTMCGKMCAVRNMNKVLSGSSNL